MKRVLLICYYFPPLGLGGVTRPLQLFRLLPSHGWDCHILTVKAVAYRAYEPELLEGLDKQKIHRAGSTDPQRLLYLLGVRKVKSSTIRRTKVASDRFFPDSKVGWVRSAVRLGRTLIENYKYDCLISTSPPVSSHLVGKKLSTEFYLPWVADFRDYWTVRTIDDSYRRASSIDRANRLLDDICAQSNLRTAVNSTIGGYVHARSIIPNGYDSRLADIWTSNIDRKRVRIGLLGHQHGTRIVEPLLRVLRELRDKSPDRFAALRIVQVGQVDRRWLQDQFAVHNMEEMLEIHGRLSRGDTIRTLDAVSLFYLALDASVFLPGRVFDILASGRPLFACGPAESEIKKMVNKFQAGFYFTDSTLTHAVEYLDRHSASVLDGSLQITPRPSYAAPFSSERMVEDFAHVLDDLS